MRQRHQEVLAEYEAAKSKYDAAEAGYESSRAKLEQVNYHIMPCFLEIHCNLG